MKLLLCLLITMATTFTGFAQTKPVNTRKNVLKITPLVALGYTSIFYERVVDPRTSVLVGVGFGGESYRYEGNKTPVPEPGKYRYQRLTLEVRRYLSRDKQAPFDFFTGGYARIGRLSIQDYVSDKGLFVRDAAGNLVMQRNQATAGALGGYIGWQAVFLRRLTFESFLGLHVQVLSGGIISTHAIPEAMSSTGISARLGLTVGYSF